MSDHRTIRSLLLALATLVAGLALGLGLAPSGAAPSSPVARVSGATIVDAKGDALNGFEIHHLNGSVDYPPTDSEALAECGEYDTLRARVRCRAHITTWYADLASMKQTITYYQRLFD